MMNDLLKKSVLAFVALLTSAVTASAENARLLSFGFYQAENPGLTADYVAEIPAFVTGTSTYEINIALPASADKTGLVARFTVNDGNTVTVDGVAQTSGVTKNDFTDPVDYTVSNSNKSSNVRYTINIVESSDKAWGELGVLDVATITGAEGVSAWAGASLEINPKDNVPYVVVRQRNGDDKLTVAKFDAEWKVVGAPSFSSKVTGSYYDLSIAPDGTPYVAYSDAEATVSGAATVMKFDGQAWTVVGDQGYSNAKVSNYLGLAALEGAQLTSFWNNVKSQTDLYRCVVLSANTGSAWATSAMAGGTCAAAAMADNGKVAYVWGRQVTATNGENIVKYENGQFSTIAEKYLPQGATQIYNQGMVLTVAPDGTLYVMVADDAEGGAWLPRLRRYDAATEKFTSVGGGVLPLNISKYSRSWEIKPAIAPDGTPYIVYNSVDDNNNLYYTYIDANTKQWATPTKFFDAPEASAGDISFRFAPNGVGYVTFTDKQNKVHLLTYDLSSNIPSAVTAPSVGKAAVSEYFSLSGARVSAPGKGLYIKRSVGADGQVTTKKVRF